MIRPSIKQCYLPPSAMPMTFPGPVARQHDREKSSAPLPQNQYNPKPHNPPDKRGAIAKVKYPPENQQVPKVSQDKKNGNNTPSSDYSDFSISADILSLLLIKNAVFFIAKTIVLSHR